MKLRLMQILLFLPCIILDGLFLGAIALPLWLICGINPNTNDPIIMWLMELKNGGNNEHQ
jgi:hypothetical protein